MIRVVWTPAALDRLKQLHDAASQADQPLIRAAAQELNDRLTTEGLSAGESRLEDFRIVIELPLVAHCWTNTDDDAEVITVVHIRRVDHKL